MIEKRIQKLEDGIKALKSSMPISGSLVDTYIYKATSTHTYANGDAYNCYAIFVLDDGTFTGQGIVDMALYDELWTSDPNWSSYNPVGAHMSNGYYVNSGIIRTYTYGTFTTTGNYNYEVRATATVYGTLPGHIEFIWE